MPVEEYQNKKQSPGSDEMKAPWAIALHVWPCENTACYIPLQGIIYMHYKVVIVGVKEKIQISNWLCVGTLQKRIHMNA